VKSSSALGHLKYVESVITANDTKKIYSFHYHVQSRISYRTSSLGLLSVNSSVICKDHNKYIWIIGCFCKQGPLQQNDNMFDLVWNLVVSLAKYYLATSIR
jgi:hypothetical protein